MDDRVGRLQQHRAAGQILPIFVISLLVILSIGALVLDGASMLVTRRHLQNAGDAAALAGANLIQKTNSGSICSNTSGPPPGAARADIIAVEGNPLDDLNALQKVTFVMKAGQPINRDAL